VLDIYTAYILSLVSNRFKNVPDFTDEHIRVMTKGKTASSHFSKVDTNWKLFGNFIPDIFSTGTQIGKEEILDNPSKFFLKAIFQTFWPQWKKPESQSSILNGSGSTIS
jgi:hypothetical protein